jgi:hypothetical protein
MSHRHRIGALGLIGRTCYRHRVATLFGPDRPAARRTQWPAGTPARRARGPGVGAADASRDERGERTLRSDSGQFV